MRKVGSKLAIGASKIPQDISGFPSVIFVPLSSFK